VKSPLVIIDATDRKNAQLAPVKFEIPHLDSGKDKLKFFNLGEVSILVSGIYE